MTRADPPREPSGIELRAFKAIIALLPPAVVQRHIREEIERRERGWT